MEGEEGDECAEAEEEDEVDAFLDGAFDGAGEGPELRHVEGRDSAGRGGDEEGEACEEDEATETEVDGDFPCGVLIVAGAAHADHEERRDEGEFVEGVEEKEVGGDEGTGCACGDEETAGVVEGVVGAACWTDPDGGEGDEDREQDHDETHAIDADVEADGGVVEDWADRGELECRGVTVVETEREQQSDGEVGAGGGESGGACRQTKRHYDRRENGEDNQQVEQAQAGEFVGS